MSEKHITFAAKNKKHETIINHSYPDAGRAWREGGNAASRQPDQKLHCLQTC